MTLLASLVGSPEPALTLVDQPSAVQLEAALAAMCAIGFVHGVLTEHKLEALVREVDALHWCDELDESNARAMLERAAERGRVICEIEGETATVKAIQELASELATVAMRQSALVLMIGVAASDGEPTAEEWSAIDVFSEGFALTDSQVDQVHDFVTQIVS